VSTVAYGGFVNYGRQFILGNILTMEYYFGVGYTGQSYSYSNPNFTSVNNGNYGYFDQARNISNYYGFMRIPTVGLSGTAGFRIGISSQTKLRSGNNDQIFKKKPVKTTGFSVSDKTSF